MSALNTAVTGRLPWWRWWPLRARFLVRRFFTSERCLDHTECRGRVRIIGPWYARHRECAYCTRCMPEAYGLDPVSPALWNALKDQQ